MMTEVVLQILGVTAALAVYFLPAIVADRRKRYDVLTIALFNACLGWTIIGWIAALYWAWLPNPPADISNRVENKRRHSTMRTFSKALGSRVERRAARERGARN